MRLKYTERSFNNSCCIFSFRLSICIEDFQVIFVEERVASSDCEGETDEEEIDVEEKHCLPDDVWFANRLFFWRKLDIVCCEIVQANAAIDHAKNAETVENK